MNYDKQNLKRGVLYGPVRGVVYGPVRGVTYDATEAENEGILEAGIKGSTTGMSAVLSTKQEPQPELPELTTNIVKADVSATLNFSLRLLRRIVEIEDTAMGEAKRCYYFVEVIVRTLTGELLSFESRVASDKIKNIDWLKIATDSLASIPQSKEEREEFYFKVQSCIEQREVPTELIYPTPGWRKVDGYGWRFIHATGMIGETTALVHTNSQSHFLDIKKELLGTAECFQEAMSMMEVCKNGVASTELFLLSHTALLTTIFQEAGYPIFFVFGLAGVTNSRKTSLVLALTKIFNREKLVADAEFATATACGIEKELGRYQDGIVIIDDFKPGVNCSEQKRMDSKLDQLLRFYGNRVEKKRMQDFSGKEEKFFPIHGVCVLTMEIVTGVMSSIARMFISEINEQDVDNRRLSYFQDRRWILPTHLGDFLWWVTQNFQEVVETVRNEFPIHRERYRFPIARFAEMYATFMTTAVLFGNYAITRGFFQHNAVQMFCNMIDEIICKELAAMSVRIKRSDKANLTIEALAMALKNGRLLPLPLNSDNAKLKEECYEDMEILYIRTKELRKITYEYCHEFHEPFEIVNDSEIIGLLERLQVLSITYKNGKEASRKLPIQKGNTLRYLYIKKGKLQEILENLDTVEPAKPQREQEETRDNKG